LKRLRITQLGWVLGLVAGCACSSQPGPQQAPAVQQVAQPAPAVRATLERISGEVMVKRATADAWLGAQPQMTLFENDKVRTARGASVSIHFVSGSVLAMGEDALVGIAEAQPTPAAQPADVTVLRGRIDATLSDPTTQSLTVTTPSATVRAGREIVFQ
jgi:hypothetical protein